MEISQATWNRYKNLLSQIDNRAVKEMSDFLVKIGGFSGHTDEILDFAFALATKYGEAAATAACEMYDTVAEASGMMLSSAEPAATATYGEVAKAVNGAVRNASELLIPSAIGRLVKQAGADTTLKNAKRDGAEFAWIPSGDSCAFCIVLASRGWQEASQKTIKGDHADHIHANCDCQFAVRFNSRTKYEGYNPEEYLEMYENADDSSAGFNPNRPKGQQWQSQSTAKINGLRREQYAKNKDKINAQKRAAYARRKENQQSE